MILPLFHTTLSSFTTTRENAFKLFKNTDKFSDLDYYIIVPTFPQSGKCIVISSFNVSPLISMQESSLISRNSDMSKFSELFTPRENLFTSKFKLKQWSRTVSMVNPLPMLPNQSPFKSLTENFN